MALAGLTLPDLSAYDPPVAGEGSLDPMGLAAISDRLADRLVPGVRARMQRLRFVTAMAVGATACASVADEVAADGISSPAICFEWLVIEAFVRRVAPAELPTAVPGTQKARTVITRNQRLSAATYLKGPSVFGFNGVYRPFAVDARVVEDDGEPGQRCAELTGAWERDQGIAGFTDSVSGTDGGRFREAIAREVSAALRAGRCMTNPGSGLFGRLASTLHPQRALASERRVLRSLILDGEHPTRAELALLLEGIRGEATEAEALEAVRPSSSRTLGSIIDAVVAYERFAAVLDAAFRTLCSVSYAMGSQPLTPHALEGREIILTAAETLPRYYRHAYDRMVAIDADSGLEERLGDFGIPRTPSDLVQLLFDHHDQVQARKPPSGKRSWFEPVRTGFVIRPAYGTPEEPRLDSGFVHPVRVAALWRFVNESKP